MKTNRTYKDLDVTFRNGSRSVYPYEVLEMMKTDYDVIEIEDLHTGEILYENEFKNVSKAEIQQRAYESVMDSMEYNGEQAQVWEETLRTDIGALMRYLRIAEG